MSIILLRFTLPATDKNRAFQVLTLSLNFRSTYFCIVYQRSLSTSASVTVDIEPLPRKEVISVYTLTPVITSCDSNSDCYFTNITVDCHTTQLTTVNCVVSNNLGHSVTSDNMTVRYVQEKLGNCKADTSQGLPISPSGSTYNVPCVRINPAMLGTIDYKCEDGNWSPPVNGCYSAVILQQLVNVQNVIDGPEVQQALPVLLENITATATSEKQNIADSSKTLQYMVKIISEVSKANVTVEPVMMQNFIKTVDVVVTKSSAWSSNANESVTILNSVEKFAENLNFNGTIDFKNDSLNNIQLYGKVVSKDDSYNKNFSLQNLTGNVFIEGGALTGNSTKIVTIAYSTMKNILPKTTQGVVNGLVMSTIIGKNSSDNIDSSIFKINMNFTESKTSLEKPDCVWYDLDQKIWNSRGCIPIRIDNVILCSCNHLTSFSVLMGSSITDQFLAIITYIGVGISLACLVITLLIEALVLASGIKNNTSYIRHVCLVNIAVTLLVADIWLIIGATLEQNTRSAACKAAAFFSFFFYLSLFFWMLTTGLFVLYVTVFYMHSLRRSKRTMKIIALLLGYGCPLLITIVTVASTEPSGKFISKKFCWLDYSDSRSFLAFVVPALTIVFVDILIPVLVIFIENRPTVGEQSGKEDRKILILIVKTIAILTPLLGTTWGFGLGVVINPDNRVVNGIFATLNSCQGLFILISTVMMDNKMQKAVRTSITSSYLRTFTSKGQTSSTYSSGTSKPKKRKYPVKKNYYGKIAV
ncbi:adhesion G protein-coupled receptor F5-like [Rana temporaria]|uniref:adhesion G protein-coupled receptor F5-like n=1 Tax=Rana temporaria TaxID=8407 RepID=UPI001AAC805E|nr:adhesion G protein-coupled receptor F5-like [Rana temporaria]